MQSDKTKKAHLGLNKAELVFIVLAVFAVAFTLGMFYRKPASGGTLIKESLTVSSPAPQSATVSARAVYMKKININTASAEELTDLPEIGEVLASRITDYRKANGFFKKPEDIMKVGGIGEKTFERIKDLICVE